MSNTDIEELFINNCPEDKEWSAHIDLLNNHTPNDMKLRHIIQYVRSGKFYATGMHQDLIEQFIQQKVIEELESFCGHSNDIPETIIKARISELQDQLNHNKKGDSNEL